MSHRINLDHTAIATDLHGENSRTKHSTHYMSIFTNAPKYRSYSITYLQALTCFLYSVDDGPDVDA